MEGSKSGPTDVVSGVPQGSVLGPFLLLIHIQDIDDRVTSSTVTSFANDTRVLKTISQDRDVELMKVDLLKIYEWATENNMKFNGDKFELIIYSHRQHEMVTRQYITADQIQIEREPG